MFGLRLEHCLVGVGLVVLLLSSGITYAFTALEVVLKREGLYADLTEAERNTKLSAIMTVAMVCVNVGGEGVSAACPASLPRPAVVQCCACVARHACIPSWRPSHAGISFGALLDYKGPVVTNICAASGFLLSCIIFGYQYNLMVGYALMAFSGAGGAAPPERVFVGHVACRSRQCLAPPCPQACLPPAFA